LSLGDAGFLQLFSAVSSDSGPSIALHAPGFLMGWGWPAVLGAWYRCGNQEFVNIPSLKLAASSPLKIGLSKRDLVFQLSIFRCELLVSGSAYKIFVC